MVSLGWEEGIEWFFSLSGYERFVSWLGGVLWMDEWLYIYIPFYDVLRVGVYISYVIVNSQLPQL